MPRFFVLFIVYIMLSGCSSLGPRYSEMIKTIPEPVQNNARIYFFRVNDSILYMGRDAAIKIDNDIKGYCPIGSFFYYDVAQGEHIIETDMWDMPGACKITLRAKKGRSYYYEVTPRWESFNTMMSNVTDPISGMVRLYLDSLVKECSGGFAIVPTTESEAIKKMSDLKLNRL